MPATFSIHLWAEGNSVHAYGMMCYRGPVNATGGVVQTAGCIDDIRTWSSMPIRHALARHADAYWIANLLVRCVLDKENVLAIMQAASHALVQTTCDLSLPGGFRNSGNNP